VRSGSHDPYAAEGAVRRLKLGERVSVTAIRHRDCGLHRERPDAFLSKNSSSLEAVDDECDHRLSAPSGSVWRLGTGGFT
jgi:hypothetical protein